MTNTQAASTVRHSAEAERDRHQAVALAKGGAVVLSEHALTESMVDDGLFPDDVLHVLVNAARCVAEDDAGVKFKVHGPIVNGTELVVVINVRADHMFVITCHLPP